MNYLLSNLISLQSTFISTSAQPTPEVVKCELIESIQNGGAFTTGERPLRTIADPSLFTEEELSLIPYDFSSPRWVFEDGEPDDFTNILLMPKDRTLFIAEDHHKRGKVLERTKLLLEKMGGNQEAVLEGNVPFLIERLKQLPDHSLILQVIAPSPTLAEIMKREPELLAQKVKRMVSYGGFVYRDCEYGRLQGEKIYYTSFNLIENQEATTTLFHFAEQHQVPFYILGGDNLKLPKTINFDLPYKIKNLGTPAAQYIESEIEIWNRIALKGWLLEDYHNVAAEHGFLSVDLYKNTMTPADVIAAVLDLSFDNLEIHSRGISHFQITDEPRYEKQGEAYLPTKHRALSFDFDPDSTIRYVDGFFLADTHLTTSETFQVLLNHLLNIHIYESFN